MNEQNFEPKPVQPQPQKPLQQQQPVQQQPQRPVQPQKPLQPQQPVQQQSQQPLQPPKPLQPTQSPAVKPKRKKKGWIAFFVTICLVAILVPTYIYLLKPLFEGGYLVTYNLYGNTETTERVAEGGVLSEPTAPTRNDYSFVGWYADEDFEEEFTFPSTIESDLSIYAKWRYASTISLTDVNESLNSNGIEGLYYSEDKEVMQSEFGDGIDYSKVKSVLFVSTDNFVAFELNNIADSSEFSATIEELIGDSLLELFVEGNIVGYSGSKTNSYVPILLGNYNANDDFVYVDYDEKVYILRYIGDSGEVVIPEKLDSKTVVRVNGYAFGDNDVITNVTISSTVRSLGIGSFFECDNLETVVFSQGSTLKYIESSAFKYSSSLVNIEWPETVEWVGDEAINCGWYSAREDGPIYIGNVFFEYKGDCPESFSIREGTKSIASYAFSEQENVNTIILPSTLEKICSDAFYLCYDLQTLTLNEGLITIENDAINHCDAIVSITIPSTVEEIFLSPFYRCSSLETIAVAEGNQNFSIISSALYKGNELICYPVAKSTTSYQIPSQTTNIFANAFYGASNLESVSMSDNVVKIGESAFKDCYALNSISLSSSLTVLNDELFVNCGLTSITIPASVISFGSRLFENCTSLESIIFSDDNTLQTIESSAFFNCTSLTTIDFPTSISSAGLTSFETYTSGVYIPWYANKADGVIYVGSVLYNFKGTMASGQTITVAEGTLTIARSAFANQTNLEQINIVASVELIEKSAFELCTGLNSVVFLEFSNLLKIGTYAFNGCSGLNGIVLPNSLEIISKQAFYNCSNMSGVLMGENIKEIGDNSFYNCGINSGGIILSITATTPPTIHALLDLESYDLDAEIDPDIITILVPEESLELYQTAWATYLDFIEFA